MPEAPTVCQHVVAIERLVLQSEAALRRHSTAGTLSAKMLGDEVIIECQRECGEASLCRDMQVTPMSSADTAALMSSCPNSLAGEFVEMWHDTRKAARRLRDRLRRRTAAAVQNDGGHGRG